MFHIYAHASLTKYLIGNIIQKTRNKLIYVSDSETNNYDILMGAKSFNTLYRIIIINSMSLA